MINKDKVLTDIETLISHHNIPQIYQDTLFFGGCLEPEKIRQLVSGYLYHCLIKTPKSKNIQNLVNILVRLEDPQCKEPTAAQLLYFLFFISQIDLTEDSHSSVDSFPSGLYL